MKHRLALIPCIVLFSGGCFIQKKPKVAVPVAPAPVPQASVPATPVPAAPKAQAAPPPVTTPTPPAPATESRKPSPFPPVAAPPKPAAAPATRPLPAPALGAVLTADQRAQLNIAYQADLRQANTVLDGLKGRSLTKDQNDTVARARAFIAQAAQYHDRDLTTAAELARRARLLTQDLAGTLK